MLLYEATGTNPPPPAEPPSTPDDRALRPGHHGEHQGRGNDLTDCLGEGLVIGAPNIVVDLNGHTIDGPDYLLGNITGQEEGFPAGIRVSGHDNVIVRNGTVQQFGWGVLLTAGTTRTVVEGLTVLGNATSGIELFDADNGRTGNTIRNNIVNDNELGISLTAGAQNSVIEGNTIRGSLGEALFLQHSSGHLFEDNTVIGIPTNPLLDSDGGILLDDSHRNVFRDNTVRDTGDAGFVVSLGSNENRFEGNTMYRNGDAGIYVQDSERNVIVDNLAHQESDGGVVLSTANGTVVRGNDLRYNPNGIETADSNNLVIEDNNGSFTSQDGFAIGNGVNLVVRNNVANMTGGVGISVEGAVFNDLGVPIGTAIIEGNTANENREAGIGVADGAGHLVRNNKAYHNAQIGIEAEGNVDGGGNMAAGNGLAPGEVPGPEPDPQCIGVVCTPGPVVPPITALDLTPPNTAITSGPSTPTSDTSATFTFTGSDLRDDGSPGTPETGLAFECRLDIVDPPPEPPEPEDPEPPHPNDPPDTPEPFEGEGWMECISPMTYHFLEPGEHKFEVKAVDPGTPDPGDKDLTAAVHEWRIDPLAQADPNVDDSIEPETRIAEAPPAVSDSSAATFRFSGSDNITLGQNLTFECRLDGGAWALVRQPEELRQPRGPRARRLRAHVRGARDRPQGQHRLHAGVLHVDGRRAAVGPDGSGHDAGSRAPGPGHGAQRLDVHVLERGPDRDVRVLARRSRLDRLHVTARAHGPHPRDARVPRPRQGPRAQLRRDAGDALVEGRRRAGRAQRRLRSEADAEHARHERPDRLRLGRHRGRRARDHDRPQRPHDRRQGDRLGHPQRRPRRRHDHGRQGQGVRLGRLAQRRNRSATSSTG